MQWPKTAIKLPEGKTDSENNIDKTQNQTTRVKEIGSNGSGHKQPSNCENNK
jgi:hypothetical protein